jgi:hypothetical protein
MQFTVVQPKPGRFPDQPPRSIRRYGASSMVCESVASLKMGLAAGGLMEQKIYPDAYGADTWDMMNSTTFNVHIVNSDMYQRITDEEAPATPISAEMYMACGLPWFALYDEHLCDLEAPDILEKVKSIGAMELKMTSNATAN